MSDKNQPCDTLVGCRFSDRRRLLIRGGQIATLGVMSALVACGDEESPLVNAPLPTPTPTGSPTPSPTIGTISDEDVLTLMAQITYLQAEFYSRAVLGVPLPPALVAGTGTAGPVTGPRQVQFTDKVLTEAMREIAFDKVAQATRLRSLLGDAAPARPAINLDGGADGAFTQLARAATEVPTTGTFDVYGSDDRFLLGAFILEDMTMLAYQGAIGILAAPERIAAIGGILGSVAYHAAFVRGQLYFRGIVAGSTLRASTIRLSDARDLFSPGDDDQGVSGGSVAAPNGTANISVTDGDGVTFGRRLASTLNTVFLTRTAVEGGGFFPAGVNGRVRLSGVS